MQLTKKQLAKLRRSVSLLTGEPTASWYFKQFWRSYLFLFVVSVSFIVYYWWQGWPLASTFIGGMLFAYFLIGFLQQRQFLKDWALSKEITDWQRIKELIEAGQSPAP
jgi:hypothetical protein